MSMTDTITRITGIQPVSPSDGWRVAAVWDASALSNVSKLERGSIPFIGWRTVEYTFLDRHGKPEITSSKVEPVCWYDDEVTTLEDLNDISNFAAALVAPGEEPGWEELEGQVLSKVAARLRRKATA